MGQGLFNHQQRKFGLEHAAADHEQTNAHSEASRGGASRSSSGAREESPNDNQ